MAALVGWCGALGAPVGAHRVDVFDSVDGTVQGCVLSCLGYCLASLSALRKVRASYPDVFVLGIIDDTNFLGRDPGRVSGAIQLFSSLMAAIGVATVVPKTGSEGCHIPPNNANGVPGSTIASDGVVLLALRAHAPATLITLEPPMLRSVFLHL